MRSSNYRPHTTGSPAAASVPSLPLRLLSSVRPHAPFVAALRLLAPSHTEGSLVTLADGHACPSKNAVSPLTSTKRPKLIGTESVSVRRCNIVLHANLLRLCHVTSCCYVPACVAQITQHPCREIFRVTPVPSTKLPKSLGTFLHPCEGGFRSPEERTAPAPVAGEARDLVPRVRTRLSVHPGGLSIDSITIRKTEPERERPAGETT